MSKADKDKRALHGEELLADWNVPADAEAAKLREHLGREPDADLAIAVRLGKKADPDGAALLRTLEDTAKDKIVRKEAKRSLYRLESQGVTVERPAREPRKLALGAVEIEGYVSAFDGRGDVLVWLTKPRAGALLHLFAVVNDPEGLKDLNLAEVSRKGLRSLRQELIDKHEIQLLEVDWRYCDFLIDRAFQRSNARGETGGDYPGLRAHFIKEGVQAIEAPIYAELDREAVRADTKLLEESASLLDEKEMRTWFLDPETAQPYLDELIEVRDSPLVLNEAQQGERLSAVVMRAVEEIYAVDKRESWQRRFEHMALYFHAGGRIEAAKKALAVGLAVGASENGGRGIPFCEALCRTSISVYWQLAEQRQKEESKSSLVVTPQQAAREAEERRKSR